MFMQSHQERYEERGMPILIVKDDQTKVNWAHVVPNKGRDPHAIERLRRDLEMLGHKEIIMKRDGENSIKALRAAVKLVSSVDIITEESPVGEHQANGKIEATVEQVQGQIRNMRYASFWVRSWGLRRTLIATADNTQFSDADKIRWQTVIESTSM